jgi:hypothetical protein
VAQGAEQAAVAEQLQAAQHRALVHRVGHAARAVVALQRALDREEVAGEERLLQQRQGQGQGQGQQRG